jgi:transcription antitermination factor NusG
MMRWYVIRSKYRNEDLLCHQLHCRNIEVYYPYTYNQRSKYRTPRIKPYFPGYLFVHVDLLDVGISDLQWIPGASGLICFDGEPAWISDSMIQSIHAQVDRLNFMHENELKTLHAGDELTIHSGPFAGYRGIFSSYLSDRERVEIFLQFVRDQQVRVELPVGQIKVLKHVQA